MTKILFICHGNICRSPMAEYLFRYLAEKRGVADRFHAESRATSTEELGNPVYPPARRVLAEYGISTDGKVSQRVTREDCDEYDHLIIMDERNRRGMAPFIGENGAKLSLLTEWFGERRDVADPWFTGDFEATRRDVLRGCAAILDALSKS